MKCPRCKGLGYLWRLIKEKCPDCNGTGEVTGVQSPTKDTLNFMHQAYTASMIWQQQQDTRFQMSRFQMYRAFFNGVNWKEPMKPQKEDLDHQLKKEMNRVLLDIAGESFFPSTQLYQLAAALLIENGSEFLLGVIDEENHFKEDCEVITMTPTGGRWGGINDEIAKVWVDEGKGVICARFPYKEKVIAKIRAEIPKGKKAWNPEGKIWEFSVETIDVLIKILHEHFDQVLDLTHPAPPMLTSQNGGDPLLSLLDEEDINRIYKVLAKRHHPDVGGNPNLMAKINAVFAKFKERK